MDDEQLEAMKKTLLMKILDKQAFERLSRVRLVNQLLVNQIELYLRQMYQSGPLTEMVTDQKLKQILEMAVEKRETKIIRKWKIWDQ